ncbi:hypothetical protein, partial [Enterobacter cloacae]|uniref:hypothetical protein n=1 Tax=Enterobacter cloacae TaxID=550 RepID=UPI003984F89E
QKLRCRYGCGTVPGRREARYLGMNDNPNAAWENCNYLLWPAWYAWLSWALLAAIFIFAGYCTIVEGL